MKKKIIIKALGYYVNLLALIAPEKAGNHAFNIFCYPIKKPLKPHQKEFLDSAEKFSFHHQNIYIQGYRWGNGPKKILFLHGWQSHSFRWKKYIQALSPEEYSIYAIDAPGHGLSKGRAFTLPLYSEVIRQVISSLGTIHAIVSHSIGSFSVLHTLHHAPSLPVKKLLIMGAPGEVGDFLHFFSTLLHLSERAARHTKAHFEKVIGKPVSYFSAVDFASTLQIPGLIIHDKKDAEAPYAYAVSINKAWKGSKLLTTEGIGHNLKSAEVVSAVTDFIKSNPIPAAPETKKTDNLLNSSTH